MENVKISPVIFCQSLVDNHTHSLGKKTSRVTVKVFDDLLDLEANASITQAIYCSAVTKIQKVTTYLHLVLAHRPQWRASQCMDSQTNKWRESVKLEAIKYLTHILKVILH